MNTQFPAANSAGHSCSIPSVQHLKWTPRLWLFTTMNPAAPQSQSSSSRESCLSPGLPSCTAQPHHPVPSQTWNSSKDWPHSEGQNLLLPDRFQTPLNCFWGYEVGGNIVDFVRKAEAHFQPVVDVQTNHPCRAETKTGRQ